MSSEVIVISRECPLCGHHEMGYITHGGAFHPLKPGTRIQSVEEPQDSVVNEMDRSSIQVFLNEEAQRKALEDLSLEEFLDLL